MYVFKQIDLTSIKNVRRVPILTLTVIIDDLFHYNPWFCCDHCIDISIWYDTWPPLKDFPTSFLWNYGFNTKTGENSVSFIWYLSFFSLLDTHNTGPDYTWGITLLRHSKGSWRKLSALAPTATLGSMLHYASTRIPDPSIQGTSTCHGLCSQSARVVSAWECHIFHAAARSGSSLWWWCKFLLTYVIVLSFFNGTFCI